MDSKKGRPKGRPVNYFSSSQIVAEDKNMVFCVLPQTKEEVYRSVVEKTLKEIDKGTDEINCVSNLDFDKGKNYLEELYHCIQKSKYVIVDISSSDPTIQYALGVIATRKDKLILLGDETIKNADARKIDYNPTDLEINYYSSKDDNQLTKIVRKKFQDIWDGPDGPRMKTAQAIAMMKEVQAYRKKKMPDMALALFYKISQLEEKNWYVQMEWGITHAQDNNMVEAKVKFDKALELAGSNRHKAEIHLELGRIYEANRQEDDALLEFEKSETLDGNSPRLFYHWALLLGKLDRGKNKEALDKAMRAKDLRDDKENQLLVEYIFKKYSDDNFNISWDVFQRRPNKHSSIRRGEVSPTIRGNRDIKSKEQGFYLFWRQFRVGDIVKGRIDGQNARIGVFVRFEVGAVGLIHRSRLPQNFDLKPDFERGRFIEVRVTGRNNNKLGIELELV